MKNLNDLAAEIIKKNPGFSDTLTNVSGWRGLFDPYCDEWHSSTEQVKANVIEYVCTFVSFEKLITLWKATEKRDYVLQDLPTAIEKIRPYIRVDSL